MENTLSELRESPHWSFSSLDSILNRCSLQWAFSHIFHIEKESTSVSLPFGTAFHAAASVYARARMKGEEMSVSEIQDAFSDWWSFEVSSDPQIVFDEGGGIDAMNEQGRGLIALLPESLSSCEKVLEVAVPFRVRVLDAEGLTASERPLIGEIDLSVMEDGGRIAIVDWKTSARRWPADKADSSLQATCMTYAHDQEIGGIPGFRFDVFVKNKKPVFESHYTNRNNEDFHRLAELVRMADRIVEAEAYHPREDWSCSSCAYKGSCKDWHRKASRKTVNLKAA